LVSAKSDAAGSVGIQLDVGYYRGELEPFIDYYDKTNHTALTLSIWGRPAPFIILSLRAGASRYDLESPGTSKTISGLTDGAFLLGLTTNAISSRLSVGGFVCINLNTGSGKRVSEGTDSYDERGLFSTFENDLMLLGAISYDLSTDDMLPLVLHLNVGKEANLSDLGSVIFPRTYPSRSSDYWRIAFALKTVGDRFSTSLSLVSRFDPDDGRGISERQLYAAPSADMLINDRYFLGTTVRVTLSADDASTSFDPSATWPDWQASLYLGVVWNPEN
jgi:hypothetical protein